MKKTVGVILTIALILLTACGNAKNRPDGTANGLSSDCPASKGDTVTVTVSFKENPGIASAILTVSYDAAHLIPVSVKYLNSFANGGERPDIKKLPMRLTWCGLADNGETEFAELTFRVTEQFGSVTESKIDINYANGDICNLEEEEIPLTVCCGSVFIK